jgi:hypothetical protein
MRLLRIQVAGNLHTHKIKTHSKTKRMHGLLISTESYLLFKSTKIMIYKFLQSHIPAVY